MATSDNLNLKAFHIQNLTRFIFSLERKKNDDEHSRHYNFLAFLIGNV